MDLVQVRYVVVVVGLLTSGCTAGGFDDINKNVRESLKELARDGQVTVALASLGHVCHLTVNRTRNLDLHGLFQCPEWTPITGRGTSYSIIDMLGQTLRDFLTRAKVNGEISETQAPQWFSSLSLMTLNDTTSGDDGGSTR